MSAEPCKTDNKLDSVFATRACGQGAGAKTIDHIVALSDGALVEALMCP